MLQTNTSGFKKNIIAERLRQARNAAGLSQRDLARELQLLGCDIDKNVITRIETNQRSVRDFELRAFQKRSMSRMNTC